MKQHDSNRHPGPWRLMQVDSEFAGLLVAVGFVVMGLVSMPIATWFLLEQFCSASEWQCCCGVSETGKLTHQLSRGAKRNPSICTLPISESTFSVDRLGSAHRHRPRRHRQGYLTVRV
jgi:hypothetical protein